MITVAIQAGGSSSRIGRDKAFITLAGESLIEHVIRRVAGLGDETLIISNNPDSFAHLGIRIASDIIQGSGALIGLHSALVAANNDTVLVVACDMPFLNRHLLTHQLQLAPQADVVVPARNNYLEPLHAVYNKQACLPVIEAALSTGEMRLISFYPEVRVRSVTDTKIAELDPTGLSFFNINAPQDLARAEQLLANGVI